ncbi:hypothetical protein FRB95_012748 [Tulasnella sp. JGI-2019a]|nr:hypothetical protein FRB95_012748 [Tulasnella sp. JGI-2019a]
MSTTPQVPVEPSILPVEEVTLDKRDVQVTHPLDPLTPSEIGEVSYAIRTYVAEHHPEIKAAKFANCGMIAPPKRDVLIAMGIPLQTGEPIAEKSTKPLPRRADADFVDPVEGNSYHVALTLDRQKATWIVDSVDKLPETVQPNITLEELIGCVDVVRSDADVIRFAAEVGILPEQIFTDGWVIGWDDRFPMNRRYQQCILYARTCPHDNLYAHPLDFMPVIDTNAKNVIHIDWPACRVNKTTRTSAIHGTKPPPLDEDGLKASGRPRIPPPMLPQNYLPDLMAAEPNYKKSTVEPLKPLHIIQPEGVSFKMLGGNVLKWQSWKMHIGFGPRQGLILSTITYNDAGEIRPVMYRLCLAEMIVPYGAPAHPHARKHVFDFGEYGVGVGTNELSLGCDCVGKVHYLPASYISHDGTAVVLKRAICIHEEDAGILWKHTDYRVGGRGHAVRSRRLVISMMATLGNYEYGFAYHFYLDGTIEFETKLTGIMNTYIIAEGELPPHGTQVSPGVNAQFHQHIFSLRVDPMIDGLDNTVVQSDVVCDEAITGSAENYAGNGFTAKDLRITSSDLAVQDYDAVNDRRWRIVNPKRLHYSSGKESSYGIMADGAWVVLKSAKDSWVRQRAAFAEHHVWVMKDVEGANGSERQWPAGRYVLQTRSHPPDSIGNWIKEDGSKSLEGTDVILFLTVGKTHITRPEDWPVMPSEHMRVTFKPQSFFERNPSLHIASARDAKSTAAFEISDDAPKAVHTHDPASTCCT